MKFIAINGSPRKKWNTDFIIGKVVDGIKENTTEENIEIKKIDLYDLNYSGCTGCMLCKKLDNEKYGTCNCQDELTSILDDIATCDGLIIGSPIYFGDINAMTKCFLERLLYPYLVYDADKSTLAPKKIQTICVYTMDLTKEAMIKKGISNEIAQVESKLERMFSYKPQQVLVCNTLMVKDYSDYKMDIFDKEDKLEYHKNEMGDEVNKAVEAGKQLVLSLNN